MTDPKAKTLALVAAVDVDVLTLRLLEISCQMKRPAGRSPVSLMAEQRKLAAHDPIAGEAIRAHEEMAQAAIQFILECVNAGQRPA